MFYNERIEEVIKKVDSDINGIVEREAQKRINEYGLNVLPSKKRESIISIFFKSFFSSIEIVLLIAMIISIIVGEYIDAGVILFIILIDVFMGTYQENKALKSVESLQKMIKTTNKVLRDKKEKIVESKNIAIGDIVLFESGNKITADCRIIECNNLKVDESTLTGESINVEKDNNLIEKEVILSERKNMLFAGCNILTGRCKAIVVATGSDTEIGKIANQVSLTKEEKTPLTIRMNKFTKQISLLIVIIAFISAAVLYFNGFEINAIFLSVVALAVAAMPEGLPLALTMALTIGSNRMSKKSVIVKTLNSVEALGSCTVIASDKTGTLTVNEQTAQKIVLYNGEEINITGLGYNSEGKVISNSKNKAQVEKIIDLCAINNEAFFEEKDGNIEFHGDSIDIAFLVLKEKIDTNSSFQIESIIPYESERQYSAVFYDSDSKLKCTVKGSLEKIMSFSKYDKKMLKASEKLSKEGFRVIAVADGEVKATEEKDIKNLKILGLVAFIDPVRQEAIESIKECSTAGIKVIMITGDHPLTALSIARELNLAASFKDVITGQEIDELYNSNLSLFDEIVRTKKVFSRVTPLDKLHIVESLKRQGEFVAVTGDGVNDAPALKTANVGIAMGSGTDVAKDTSDMIITDDNFKSIVTGIKEGRIAYANIKKIILFLLSCGVSEVLFYLLAVVSGSELPLIAIQLLWINIVATGLQDVALSFETAEESIMHEKPMKSKENLFNFELFKSIILYGVTIAIIIFATWLFLINNKTDLVLSRSIIMMLMVFSLNFLVLISRSKKSIFKTPLKTNPLVIVTVIGSVILQLIITETPFLSKILSLKPISMKVLIIVFLLSLILIIVSEVYKFISLRFKKKAF